MTRLHRTLLIIVVLAPCIGCDLVTKDMARQALTYAPRVSLLNETIHFLYAENPGAVLSLGANLPPSVRFWLFTVGGGVLLAGFMLFVMLRRGASHREILGYALVLGGGASNLLDRILNGGHVIDFVMIELGTMRSAIFNMADVFIVAGVVVLAFEFWQMCHVERVQPA